MTARDWRGFSEEQWGRLGGAVSADRGTRSQRSASLAEFRRFSLGLAPVALCAAFLLAPSESGTRRPTAGGVVSEEIKMKSIEWVGLVVAGVVSSSAVGQNLLVNGGLEGGNTGTCYSFVSPSGGSTAIPGWRVLPGPNVDWTWSVPTEICCDGSPEGDRTIDLNGSPPQNGGAIAQVVKTVPGSRYRLTLLALANGCCGPIGTPKTLRIQTDGVVTDHTVFTLWENDHTVGVECDPDAWTTVGHEWIAEDFDTEVILRSMVVNSAGGVIIDDVVVERIVCPGDLDGSDSVTGVDLAIILTNWNAPNPKYPEADVNGDGAVDGADLAIVLSNWGPCP
jgi:hypothetical protein